MKMKKKWMSFGQEERENEWINICKDQEEE